MQQQRASQDKEWLTKFIREKDVKTAGSGAWYRIVYAGDRLLQETGEEAEFTIAVNRRLSDGTLIADSDLSGLVLQEKLHDFPAWLQVVIKEIRLHGEAELAVKVNDDGEPWDQGSLVEHWRIRVVEEKNG